MHKVNYYRKETFEEFFWRMLAKGLSFVTISVMVAVAIVILMANRQLSKMEHASGINFSYNYEERLSVEQSMKMYIDSLPVPEEVVEVQVQEEVITEEMVVEEVQIVSMEDVDLLAHLMYAEEGILLYKLSAEEAKRAHMLAGSVVLHRLNMNYMGAQTIHDVIYTKGQYASVETDNFYQEVPDIVYQWAEELLLNGPIGPENMIFQAEFEQGTSTYDHIYNQYFCVK